MIEARQVRERAQKLYSDMKRRSAATYWKSGKRRGMIRWEGAPLPSYSSDYFATWIQATIGCNAFVCPYCGAPLDALSMTLDHDIPLHRGGDNEIPNLVFCCDDDNNLKGELTGEEYKKFRAVLRGLGRVIEANILGRVRAGEMGKRLSRQQRAGAARKLLQAPAVEEEF